MHTRYLIVFLSLALLLAGCPKEEKFDPSEHPPSPIGAEEKIEAEDKSTPEAKLKLEEPTPNLLEAGAEPREPLRFQMDENSGGQLDVLLQISMKEPQVLPMPNINLKMNVFDLEASENEFSYSFRFESPTLSQGETPIPADRLTAMQDDLLTLGELEGKATLNSEGILKDLSFANINASPEMEQMLIHIDHAIRSLTLPLPTESVGIGARWEIVRDQKLNELVFQERTIMTLQEREGNKIVINTEVVQNSERQQIADPQLPQDAKLFVDKMSGKSAGVSHIDLSSLVPHKPTFSDSTTSMDMEIVQMDQMQKARMSMGVKTTVQASQD